MDIITRDQWGARPPRRPSVPMRPDQLIAFVVHCIGTRATRVPGDRRMRSTQNYHMDGTSKHKKPWSDIAYSYGMDLDGITYAGRGSQAGSFAEGKDRQGHQYNGRSISLLVQVDVSDPIPDHVVERMVELYRWVHDALDLPRPLRVMGHRQIRPKACPGDHLMKVVQADIWHLNPPTPPTPPEPPSMPPPAPLTPDEAPAGLRAELDEAVKVGITTGGRPNEYATRAEAAVMAYRARS